MEAIIVAVVTAIPATLVAAATWRRTRTVQHNVGITNGSGTVAFMLEDVLARLIRIEDLADGLPCHGGRYRNNRTVEVKVEDCVMRDGAKDQGPTA